MSESVPQSQDFSGSTAGLVGYWPFDGDLRNRGSLVGADAEGLLDEYSASLFDGSRALHFNGLARLAIPAPANAGLHGDHPDGFTLEVMLQSRAREQQGAIVHRAGLKDPEKGFELAIDGQRLTFSLRDGRRTLAVSETISKDWHYIAATLRREQVEERHRVRAELWIDGELAERQELLLRDPFEHGVEEAEHSIGGRRRSNFLYAEVDFIRHWDRALSAEEIKAYATPGLNTKNQRRGALGAY